jgi:hypothetical protein
MIKYWVLQVFWNLYFLISWKEIYCIENAVIYFNSPVDFNVDVMPLYIVLFLLLLLV